MAGNSLIGLMQVDDANYNGRHIQGDLFRKTYREVLEEKNRLTSTYRSASSYHEDLQSLRNNIDTKKAEALETLDEILLEDFKALKIKFEQAHLGGKLKKRPLNRADIKALKPFYWGYEFDEILQLRGGFDAMLRSGGLCGVIVPTGVYTNYGTKQLREMLFSQSNLDTLFELFNERFIFEGVDHRFKFCLLAFEKGKSTDSFKAAFRIDPREAIRVNQLDTLLLNELPNSSALRQNLTNSRRKSGWVRTSKGLRMRAIALNCGQN